MAANISDELKICTFKLICRLLDKHMDHDFFRKLKKKEAKLFLANYLSEASAGFATLLPDLSSDGISADFSYTSLPPVMLWFSRRMVKIEEKPDTCLPAWITETEDYKNSLFSFDDSSGILLLRASWYWGETFVRSSGLRWDTGRLSEFKNQPVIMDFYHGLEMSPFQICTNIIRNLISGGDKAEVGRCIDSWLGFAV
jgi:hypothetical protein